MTMGTDIRSPDPGVAGNPDGSGEEETPAGRLVGLRELKAAFRRRRRFLLFATLSGVLIGAALHAVLPPRYKAVSNLYLVEPPTVLPADAMANEVSLLQTRAVARQAATYLPGHPDTQSVATSYKGQAVSGSILSISATGRTPAKAVELNTAVTKAFLAVRSEELQRETNVVVGGLQSQIADLKGDPNTVELQRSQLQNSQLAAELSSRSSIQGSFVLDPAETVKVSAKKVIIEDTLSGLVAGLGLGGGVVVIGEMLSDRAWRREDVAADLGVAVELSLTLRRRRLWPVRRRAPGARMRPAAAVERRLRAHLDGMGSRSLAIFGVEAERVAADAVSSLGAALAAEGETVFLVDMARGHPIVSHFALGERSDPVQKVELGGASLTVVVASDGPGKGRDSIVRGRADYVLVMASVDPAVGVEDVAAWTSDGVAVVMGGKASHYRLVGIGRMIRRAGIFLRSTILINADPGDDSVGILDSDSTQPSGNRAVDVVPVG